MLISSIFFIFNKIIEMIGSVIGVLYALLPNSPFVIVSNSEFSNFISQINYFVPVYEFLSIMETWLVCVAVFYLYSIFARWIKAIE